MRGRVCFMGLGNTDFADDGFGVCLAEALVDAGFENVIVAGASPERYLGSISEGEFDDLIFLDAVEFGGASGSVVFLNAHEITTRFPQISTHKMSLAMLAALIGADGTRAWLLGVQPESLKVARPLTPAVQTTLSLVKDLLLEIKRDLHEASTCAFMRTDGAQPRLFPHCALASYQRMPIEIGTMRVGSAPVDAYS